MFVSIFYFFLKTVKTQCLKLQHPYRSLNQIRDKMFNVKLPQFSAIYLNILLIKFPKRQ